jgi:hypothetical protein
MRAILMRARSELEGPGPPDGRCDEGAIPVAYDRQLAKQTLGRVVVTVQTPEIYYDSNQPSRFPQRPSRLFTVVFVDSASVFSLRTNSSNPNIMLEAKLKEAATLKRLLEGLVACIYHNARLITRQTTLVL